jgi:hypothetical protein
LLDFQQLCERYVGRNDNFGGSSRETIAARGEVALTCVVFKIEKRLVAVLFIVLGLVVAFRVGFVISFLHKKLVKYLFELFYLIGSHRLLCFFFFFIWD